ncbi:MAG: DUF3892 domain-containing protein [bacterium]
MTIFAERRIVVKSMRKYTMAADIQVRCINKADRTNFYERIRNIGGLNADGSRWKLGEDEAIAGMKTGRWTFYTSVNNVRANVRIGWHHLKPQYLTTEPDGYQPNNLLALPECP